MIWRLKIKIKTRILAGFILLAAFSSIMVAFFALRQFGTILKEQILTDLILVAETKEGNFFDFLEMLKGRAVDFSSDGLIRDLAAEIFVGGDGRVRDLLAEHLIRNKMPLDKFLLGIDILDLNGRVVASTDKKEIGHDESAENYFFKAKELNYGEVYVSDVFISRHFEGKSVLAISAPLTDKNTGRLVGVLANFVDAKNLSAMMAGERQIQFGAISGILGRMQTFEAYLVNAEGFPLTELKFAPDAVLKRKADVLPVRKCREENKEISALYGNYLDAPVIGASMCLPNGWTLIVEMGQDEALGRLGDAQRNLLFIISAVFAVSVGIAYVIARGIANPIARLTQTAEKIKGGDFSQKAEAAAEDEIGRLAVSFNEMVEKMKKRVEESEKLTAVMVGRELRMVELKKEIEELKKKAGTAGDNLLKK